MTDGAMGLSAADVAAVTRNNDDDWGGGCWWIWIILLAFLFPDIHPHRDLHGRVERW